MILKNPKGASYQRVLESFVLDEELIRTEGTVNPSQHLQGKIDDFDAYRLIGDRSQCLDKKVPVLLRSRVSRFLMSE